MSCEICRRNSCTRSFHSLEEQERFDQRQGMPDDVNELRESVQDLTTELNAARAELAAEKETARYWEKSAEHERDQRQKHVGEQEYRGNTVSYIYDKAKVYGDMVHGCVPALASAGFPVDENDPQGRASAIANAVNKLKTERDAHAALLQRMAAALEEAEGLLDMEVEAIYTDAFFDRGKKEAERFVALQPVTKMRNQIRALVADYRQHTQPRSTSRSDSEGTV